MTFDQYIAVAKELVEGVVKQLDEPDDEIYPVLLMWGFKEMDDDEPGNIVGMITPDFISNDVKKLSLANSIIPGQIVAKRAIYFVFISEVMALVKRREEAVETDIQDHPDATENVMLIAGSRDGDWYIVGAPVFRADEQPPVLGEWGTFLPETKGNVLEKDTQIRSAGMFFEPAMIAIVMNSLIEPLAGDPEVMKSIEELREIMREGELRIDDE